MVRLGNEDTAIVSIRLRATVFMNQTDEPLQREIHKRVVKQYRWRRGLKIRFLKRGFVISRHWPHSLCWSWFILISATNLPKRRWIGVTRRQDNTEEEVTIWFFNLIELKYHKQYRSWITSPEKLEQVGFPNEAALLHGYRRHMGLGDEY